MDARIVVRRGEWDEAEGNAGCSEHTASDSQTWIHNTDVSGWLVSEILNLGMPGQRVRTEVSRMLNVERFGGGLLFSWVGM